jgi:outer membrane lipoprotein SlyB
MTPRKLWIAQAAFALAALAGGPVFAACTSCGVVVDTRTVKKEGEGSGAGMVLGGVVGGVLGHQIGSGRGNTAATVLGAAGGAYAGNEIEKNRNTTTQHQVVVKMDEGGNTRYFNFKDPTSYRVGDKVRVVDGKLVRQK